MSGKSRSGNFEGCSYPELWREAEKIMSFLPTAIGLQKRPSTIIVFPNSLKIPGGVPKHCLQKKRRPGA